MGHFHAHLPYHSSCLMLAENPPLTTHQPQIPPLFADTPILSYISHSPRLLCTYPYPFLPLHQLTRQLSNIPLFKPNRPTYLSLPASPSHTSLPTTGCFLINPHRPRRGGVAFEEAFSQLPHNDNKYIITLHPIVHNIPDLAAHTLRSHPPKSTRHTTVQVIYQLIQREV